MTLKSILLTSKVAKSKMSVRELFEECLRGSVQALPFCDDDNKVTGRVTLKHVIQKSIISDHMAQFAHVISHDMDSIKDAEQRLRMVFDCNIGPYVQEPHASITSDTPLGKALAVMEHHHTSYLFVIDDDKYVGTLSIQGIARYEVDAQRKATL